MFNTEFTTTCVEAHEVHCSQTHELSPKINDIHG